MATGTTPFKRVLELAGNFVQTQKGEWDHDAWERLCDKVAKEGIPMDDSTKRNLGNLLEATRYFYGMKVEKAPSKAKAKTKAKPKTKAKAKPARKR